MNCCSVGLYHSNRLPTDTNISPTNGAETHCSCEIGYRLLLRYCYADGLWFPMTLLSLLYKTAHMHTKFGFLDYIILGLSKSVPPSEGFKFM